MAKNKSNNIKLSLLIPVFNEGINLKMMLRILRAAIEVPHEVLIVHDIPNDDSIPVVKSMQPDYPGLKLVHNQLGRGIPNAIRSGVAAAAGDYVLIIAADDIGPILAVDDMIRLMDKGCDFVSATRYAHGGRILGGYFASRLLSRIANRLFYAISGSALTDLTLGVKMFRRPLFEKLSIESKPVGWAVAFEMAIKVQRMGLKLGEVPIISINRFYGGKSSFRLGPWVIEYSKWFFRGLKGLHRAKGRKAALIVPEKIDSIRKKNQN